MNIAEIIRFYRNDDKKYNISKNKEFLSWYKKAITSGYSNFIPLEQLQELIDKIATWYEYKYPEREFKYYEGEQSTDFQDLKKISDVMTIEQLLYRLSRHQLCLMKCSYRANGSSQNPIYDKNGKVIEWEPKIFIQLNKKNQDDPFWLEANPVTGKIVENFEINKYLTDTSTVNLNQLLDILSKMSSDELDITELKKSVFNHKIDIELRHRILQLVALKLLYSKNTTPERGYERAKRFTNEFNKKLGIHLSTEEIDGIMYMNYTNTKKSKCLIK